MDNDSNSLTHVSEKEPIRKRRRKWPIAVVLALVASGLWVGYTFANLKEFSKTDIIKLNSINNINIQANASIELVEGSGDEINIYMDGKSSHTPGYEVSNDGETLTVKFNKSIMIGVAFSDLKMKVSVPKSYHGDVSVSTSSGAIDFGLSELEDVEIKASSGTIQMGVIKAESLEVKCSSGSISIDGIEAKEAEFSCSSGSIDVKKVMYTDLSVETSSGNIDVEYALFDNEIDIGCSSGRIMLELPKDSKFELDARATSGSISNDFSLELETNEKSKLIGQTLGDTDNEITLRATSGTIDIKER